MSTSIIERRDYMTSKKVLTNTELISVKGGAAIPLAVWAIWGSGFGMGLSAGITTGLNKKNRKKGR